MAGREPLLLSAVVCSFPSRAMYSGDAASPLTASCGNTYSCNKQQKELQEADHSLISHMDPHQAT